MPRVLCALIVLTCSTPLAQALSPAESSPAKLEAKLERLKARMTANARAAREEALVADALELRQLCRAFSEIGQDDVLHAALAAWLPKIYRIMGRPLRDRVRLELDRREADARLRALRGAEDLPTAREAWVLVEALAESLQLEGDAASHEAAAELLARGKALYQQVLTRLAER